MPRSEHAVIITACIEYSVCVKKKLTSRVYRMTRTRCRWPHGVSKPSCSRPAVGTPPRVNSRRHPAVLHSATCLPRRSALVWRGKLNVHTTTSRDQSFRQIVRSVCRNCALCGAGGRRHARRLTRLSPLSYASPREDIRCLHHLYDHGVGARGWCVLLISRGEQLLRALPVKPIAIAISHQGPVHEIPRLNISAAKGDLHKA